MPFELEALLRAADSAPKDDLDDLLSLRSSGNVAGWIRWPIDLKEEPLVAGVRALNREEERELIERCLGGDPSAFDTVVNLFGSMVYNLAYRHLGDREEALDLSQEAFLRVHRSLGRFRGDSSLKTWIFRIVVNLAKNRRKSWQVRRRDRTVSLDTPLGGSDEADGPSLGDRISDDRQDPETDAQNRNLTELVEEAMGDLSEDHREVLVLRDMEELSYEEISEVLGVSVGTVKSRISRARSGLRDVLKDRL